MRWHTDQLKLFLHDNPKFIFDIKTFKNLTVYGKSNAGATIEAMICNSVFQKKGINGLKRIMNYDSLKKVIKNDFKNENDFDTLVRKLLFTYKSNELQESAPLEKS